VRNSRAVRVMELLEAEGARVEFADPLVPAVTLGGTERKGVALDALPLDDLDLIVVLVRNAAWPVEQLRDAGVPVFDAVNALDQADGARHERL